MLNNYKKYKNIKMPEDMKMNILENVRESKPKKKVSLKRRIIIIAATFTCLVILVSAGLLYNPMYNYGAFSASITDEDGNTVFVDVEIEEFYLAPQILYLNEKTKVDSVTRTKFVGDGISENQLDIVLTDVTDTDIKIITKEHGEFEESFMFSLQRKNDYSYTFLEFPEINEFTIVNGENSVDVILEPYNGEIDGNKFKLSDH